MNEDIDNRLRAHFADRAEHEALPTTPGDVPVLRGPRPRWQRPSWLAAAAAVLVLAGVAAGLALADEDGADEVDVVGTDGSTTTTAATGTSTTARSAVSSTTTTVPTPNTDPGAMATRSVVVALDGVLGWWDGSRWVRSDSGEPVPVTGGERYTVLQLGQPPRTATGSEPREGCEFFPDPVPPVVDLGLEYPRALEPHPVAVSGVADPQPRATESLDSGSAVYRQVAVDVMAGLGVNDGNPRISQLLRTDLEGDGVDEVLLNIERLDDTYSLYARPGDYSVLALRRVVDGQATTDLLHSYVVSSTEPPETAYIEVARVDTVADFNGDAQMEIAVNRFQYEGTVTAMFELTSAGPTEVLSVGCGV